MRRSRIHLFYLSRKAWLSGTAAILASSCLSPCLRGQTATIAPGNSGSAVVSVSSERPLAEVLYALQQRFMVPITFEEAPFASVTDLRSIPVKQPDGSVYTFRELPVVDFAATIGAGEAASVVEVQSVVTAYGSAGLPGVYAVTQRGDRISVFPKQVRATAGNMQDVTPVMDYPVSFPLATRGSVETLQLLASVIGKESGTRVEVLNVPFHLSDTITMSASGESASDVIARIGEIVKVPLSFQCLYDATTATHWLNVSGVFAPNPVGPAATHGYTSLPSSPGPPDSPWFAKQPQAPIGH